MRRAVPAAETIAAGARVYLDGRKRCGMVVRGREGETTTTRQCPANETLGSVAWALVDARFRRRLFRKRSRVRQRGRSRWVSRSEGLGGLGGGETDGPDRAFRAPFRPLRSLSGDCGASANC